MEEINCTGCMGKIERNLSSIPEVTSARVNLTDNRLAPAEDHQASAVSLREISIHHTESELNEERAINR
ncbi:heavy metal-associated domain-containing protein [Bradyrhizobium sp. LMG 9283]|uniref:heavy-metal-associated domain-containing protein n=1 Tax=Bradyrhizobium sp. LMG 9283 TaxID=592064 RepID=UPI00388E1735